MEISEIPFSSADILLPRNCDLTRWSVVACDQYTAQPEYWKRVENFVADAPSTLRTILPEADLKEPDEKIRKIQACMREYWNQGIFTVLRDSFVYLEREFIDGRIHHGIVGMVDLEAYDPDPEAGSCIRATEGTVQERIPPRLKVRQGALMEFPHILLLVDDPEDLICGLLQTAGDQLPTVYDFTLMEQGGHVHGRQVTGSHASALLEKLKQLQERNPASFLFAVGDGNHSLAAAKACYEKLKAEHPGEDLSGHPARFALVEVQNIHDASLEFAPIHRLVSGVDPQALLCALKQAHGAQEGLPVQCILAGTEETIYLKPSGSELPVGILQRFLDRYLQEHGGSVDYIHGDSVVRDLARREDRIGFCLPAMEKSELFPAIQASGILPRKTFSMGAANEKRFYLEGRLIQNVL